MRVCVRETPDVCQCVSVYVCVRGRRGQRKGGGWLTEETESSSNHTVSVTESVLQSTYSSLSNLLFIST